ncbi:MAG: hypothetical protein CVU43_10140 [Chloroflexi bacterium HGW-Chloroflexi-5]|jgi:hypothetical protein|nr:MAG: hypothetical protein CVU43_10140 [Chloroflexi bacterium HGW-Chloroflexi-5]
MLDPIDEIERLHKFAEVSLTGLNVCGQAKQSVELNKRIDKVLKRPSRYSSQEQYDEEVKNAENLESFVSEEKKTGFDFLFSLLILRLWTILETYIDDLIFDLLDDQTYFLTNKEVQSIKVPLAYYQGLSLSEQKWFIISEIKNILKSDMGPGVNHFEPLLRLFDLQGNINEDVKKVIYEFSQIRNLIAHKNGMVDQTFIKKCPKFSKKIGEKIYMTNELFHLYKITLIWYLLDIEIRIGRVKGMEKERLCELEGFKKDLIGDITELQLKDLFYL